MGNDPRTANTTNWFRQAKRSLINGNSLNAILPWTTLFDGVGRASTNTRAQMRDLRACYKNNVSGRWVSLGVGAGASAQVLDRTEKDVCDDRLAEVLDAGYDIFDNERSSRAVLQLGAELARRVAREQWHPEHQGCFLDDGRYELRQAFTHEREVRIEALRHGDGCEVVGHVTPRARTREEIGARDHRYEEG